MLIEFAISKLLWFMKTKIALDWTLSTVFIGMLWWLTSNGIKRAIIQSDTNNEMLYRFPQQQKKKKKMHEVFGWLVIRELHIQSLVSHSLLHLISIWNATLKCFTSSVPTQPYLSSEKNPITISLVMDRFSIFFSRFFF